MNEQLIDLTELQRVLQDYARDAEVMYKYQLSLGNIYIQDEFHFAYRMELKHIQAALNLQFYLVLPYCSRNFHDLNARYC